LMGMADAGQLPKFLAKRSKYGTPTIGVLLCMIGVVFTAPLEFTQIIELVNILYIFAELIEVII
jgi:amino acid transporter